MKKEQVHAKPLVVDPEPALAVDEGKVVAEFEEEGFEVTDERVLEVGLRVFIAQAEELNLCGAQHNSNNVKRPKMWSSAKHLS